MNFSIRQASLADIQTMILWAKEEGWNPGLQDHLAFPIADPNGFFMGYVDNNPIASISAVKYSDKYGFMGFYIVKPEFRGNGYGFSLWNQAINYLQGCNVGLDGVIAQQENYKKSGFKLAHRNIRYGGQAPLSILPNNLIAMRNIPFNVILEYDQTIFKSNRAAFLSAWLSLADAAFAVVKNNRLLGYGSIRKCYDGYKIGPLFANNFEIAEQIFLGLCNIANQQPVFIDLPETNAAGIKLIESYGFKPAFETARMYTKSFDNLELEKVFGITSFELG